MALHRAGKTDADWLHRELHGRLRDELLNETPFTSLAQTRVALECWRADYNGSCPHSKLDGRRPPSLPSHSPRDWILRRAMPRAPRHLPWLPPPVRAIETRKRTPEWIKLGNVTRDHAAKISDGAQQQPDLRPVRHMAESGVLRMRNFPESSGQTACSSLTDFGASQGRA